MNEKSGCGGVVMDVRVGEELALEMPQLPGVSLGPIRVLVEKKDGQRARLRIIADARIKVARPQPRIPAKAG